MRIHAMVVAGLLALGVVVLPVAGATAGTVTPECSNADLAASYKVGGSAMSHTYGRIVLTNVSGATCLVHGYGGLSYVGHGDGTQIGAAATRDPDTVRTITLKAGERVLSRVVETSYAPFPRRKCHPTHVDGFRVYVPNATASQFIAHPTTGCSNPAVHLLSHKAFHRPA